MNYDKNILIENIYAFSKSKGLNIKDVEMYGGVSQGYFLRMGHDKKNPNASPTLATMLAISETLGVSIETLVVEKPQYSIPDNMVITSVVANPIENEKDKRKEYIKGYIDGVKSVIDVVGNEDKKQE